MLSRGGAVSASPDGYLVSIDEIERRTGLDFFSELPPEKQSVLETHRVARTR